MAEDPQAERVYAWEKQWADWNRPSLTLRECRALMRQVCDDYAVPPVRVRTHSRTYSVAYSNGEIRLARHHLNTASALHEVAHWVVWNRNHDVAHHGPLWLGIYLRLLAKAELAPRMALQRSARSAGLKWLPAREVAPGRIGKKKAP